MAPRGPAPLLGKRALGWLSWRVKRRHHYQPRVLEALLRDLDETRPDHLAITGDLTNVSLPEEFVLARKWLERLGRPDAVTAIPGNHDAYVRVPEQDSWGLWRDYLVSDPEGEAFQRTLFGDAEPGALRFPTLRHAGPLALVGLSSARPTAPLLASGRIGDAQLARLSALLDALGSSGRVRVVLVHHPPERGVVSPRRALADLDALGAVLRVHGAELVLHGHLHRSRIGSLPGRDAPIPVVGVRSASHVGGKPGRVARYHLYDVAPDGGIVLRAREYDASRDAFAAVDEPPQPLRG